MSDVITGLAAMTELEAINTMLGAIGEQPLPAGTNLATATQSDMLMAIDILRKTSVEVQKLGWLFNTEHGYEIVQTATYSWVDTAGVTTPLSIFVAPAGLMKFQLTKTYNQLCVDTSIRPSRKYSPGAMVFYDRGKGRDGFPSSERTSLYIDPTWLFDFQKIPETARTYIAARATRIFVESSLGSQSLAQPIQNNERYALRDLKLDQGLKDDDRWLSALDLYSTRGGRVSTPRGYVDVRQNRNTV